MGQGAPRGVASYLAQLQQVGTDAFQTTRLVLTMRKPPSLPPGVTHVRAVAAYPEHQMRRDYVVGDSKEATSDGQLGLLLANRFLVPKISNADEALLLAVGLARDNNFKQKRRAYYEWQERTIHAITNEGMTPENAAEEMAQLLTDYNHCVRAATKKTAYKLSFTLAGTGLSLAAAPLAPLALAGAFVGLVRFATLDLTPVVAAGEAGPPAMFHEGARGLGRIAESRPARTHG